MPYVPSRHLLPDHASILMTAAKDAIGDWSDEQRAAATLVAEIFSAAWTGGLERDQVLETAVFLGTDAERLAAAQQFVEHAAMELPTILHRYGLGPKPQFG